MFKCDKERCDCTLKHFLPTGSQMLRDQHLVDTCDAAADAAFFTGAACAFPDLTSEGHRGTVGAGVRG